MKPLALFLWKSVVHLLLLLLSTHDLRGIVHINSQGLILSTLFFPKFHRKVVEGMFSGEEKKGMWSMRSSLAPEGDCHAMPCYVASVVFYSIWPYGL